jgi:RNA recognition motif. (a.k.a. RRM, RBD, or RNP domain)
MSSIAKRAATELRYPTIKGYQCRVLPYSVKLAKMQSKGGAATGVASGEDQECYVFVKGFNKDRWLHSDLYQAFKKFGTIVSAKVSIDKSHQSKGFGYVQFTNSSDAVKAIQEVTLKYFFSKYSFL